MHTNIIEITCCVSRSCSYSDIPHRSPISSQQYNRTYSMNSSFFIQALTEFDCRLTDQFRFTNQHTMIIVFPTRVHSLQFTPGQHKIRLFTAKRWLTTAMEKQTIFIKFRLFYSSKFKTFVMPGFYSQTSRSKSKIETHSPYDYRRYNFNQSPLLGFHPKRWSSRSLIF